MKKKIWIIGGDSKFRQVFLDLLGMAEYESRTFEDTSNASRTLLLGECPHILVIYVQSEKGYGMNLLQFIRQHKTWEELPVMIVLPDDAQNIIKPGLDSGADGYVFRSASQIELMEAIRATVQRRKIFLQ